MSTLDLTASNVDGGCDDLIRCQLVEKQADRGDIGDSIHGADFMEVDLAYRFVVSFAFGFRDEAIDRQDIGTDGFRKFQVVDDMMDVVEAAVGVIMMMVVGVIVMMDVGVTGGHERGHAGGHGDYAHGSDYARLLSPLCRLR